MIPAIILWISTAFGSIHPFHVSVCDIEYNKETKSLEIIHHIFLDDLEAGLRKIYDPKLDIIYPANESERDRYIKEYIESHFSVHINGKVKTGNYLGHEIENDALLCYIEIEGVKKLKEVTISNTLLMEEFDDQVNLVHIEVDGKTRSLKLDKKDASGKIEYKD